MQCQKLKHGDELKVITWLCIYLFLVTAGLTSDCVWFCRVWDIHFYYAWLVTDFFYFDLDLFIFSQQRRGIYHSFFKLESNALKQYFITHVSAEKMLRNQL